MKTYVWLADLIGDAGANTGRTAEEEENDDDDSEGEDGEPEGEDHQDGELRKKVGDLAV